MTDPRPAKNINLTDPEPGVFVFSAQTDDGELKQYRLDRSQVLILNKQTADILVKAFK